MKTYSLMDSQEPLVIMGPTGAGKTETVKKLSKMAFEKGIPVSILAFDPVKKSSYDELLAFSESTGVPFQFSYQSRRSYGKNENKPEENYSSILPDR